MTLAITFLIAAPFIAMVMLFVYIAEHTTILDRIADQPGMGWLHEWLNDPQHTDAR